MTRSANRSRPFRVQVVAGETLEYFRETVIGARRYGFSTGRLEFVDRWLDHELAGDLRRLVRRDGVQGIVAAIHTAAEERRFAALGIPVVNVSNSLRVPRLPVVTQDDVAVGRLAAEHLRACGCRTLGFWGQEGSAYSEDRLAGFRESAGGVPVEVAESGPWNVAPARTYARMKRWLARFPTPAGLFAVLDTYALSLMRAARELGLRVPEDVAVLGAGDEDFWVEFESVPLSSVRLPARRIGYEAAALLDRLVRGEVEGTRCLRLTGAQVVARRSTDAIQTDDEAVARAARFIRDHAVENPYVADVARAAGLSTVALQNRFRRGLGRTVLEEILRVRIERARELLADSGLKMSVVAERCGFPNSQRFSVVFRRLSGMSPGAFRRRFSQRAG